MSKDGYDLAVIGAGINGAGIARDAAMRGLKVVLLEKDDVCSGTSWISSRLIHGGLRYLEYFEIPLVYESLHERRYLRQIAGHLVRPLRISIPIYESARRGKFLIRLGMLAYDILSWNKAMPRHEMLGRDAMSAAAPGLAAEGLKGGARYFDAQVEFAERLGVSHRTIPIEPAHAAFLDMLAPSFAGTEEGVAEENLQPRVRGTLLMALSNTVPCAKNASRLGVVSTSWP